MKLTFYTACSVIALPLIGAGSPAFAADAPSESRVDDAALHAATPDPQAHDSVHASEATAELSSLGEIIVTARKREESSLKVPIAITAYSAESLDAMNVQSVEELAAVTPGITINSIAGGQNRSDRSKETIIIRGMAPDSGADTTSVFINGVPANRTAVSGIFDFARVEILKGPQSAYFGRQTFAGAVNLVTIEPTDHFQGYAEGLIATGNDRDLKGAFGGPLIPDLLSFRASARYFSRDGTWNNEIEPGNTLGDQSTRSGTLELKITPADNLKINLFGMISNDDDGNGAYGLIQASQSNCLIGGVTPYFCGTLPHLLSGQPSVRTTMNQGLTDMILGGLIFPSSDGVSHMGFRRDTQGYSARVSYDLPDGINISSLTGYNWNRWSMLSQMGGAASTILNTFTSGPDAQQYTDWPLAQQHTDENFSQELRVSSPQNSRFRWMLGGSYLWSNIHETYVQLYYLTGLSSGYAPATAQSKTRSGFVGLAYDLFEGLAINFDARYQSDRLISRDGQTDQIGYQKTYTNFMPRVSISYNITPNVMVYGTYSQGVNPGLAQDPLLSVPQSYREGLREKGITDGVNPERLDNYEVGLKGKFLDGHLIVSADAYYDIWKDKIIESALLIPVPGAPPLYVFVDSNLGRVNLPGAELEITAMPTRNLTLFASGAMNDSKIKSSGTCDACARQTGSADAVGNQLPYTPKYSANAWGEYSDTFVPRDDFKWFVRSELNYKGPIYESEGNYAKTPSSLVANFRIGLRSSRTTIEAFVTNAFDNTTYASARPGWNLANPTESFGAYSTVYVGLPDLRRFGIRIRQEF
jgi:iron complex outermembrane receptor protein